MVHGKGDGRPQIAVLADQPREVLDRLARDFDVVDVHAAPADRLRDLGAGIRGVVTTGWAGVPGALIRLMPDLEICAISGVGLETTDLNLCRERGIVVTTAPVMFDDVADLAIALALAACRRLVAGDKLVRSGRWGKQPFTPGRKLTGMRTGIIGLGRIGQEVAQRLAGFRTTIAYADPVARDVPYRRYPDIETLARNSDVLFLCAAGAPKGSGQPFIADRKTFEALGPRGIFINVARGWLADEVALCELLADGRLGAAGLDVFHDEPNVPEALWSLDNLVVSPHIASHTEETNRGMGDSVVDNLVAWFSGQAPLTPVADTFPPRIGAGRR